MKDYDLSFGKIRYFLCNRCFNDINLQKFNKGMISANELVTFDCGLMELKEIENPTINDSERMDQILAIIVRPGLELNDSLKLDDHFEFCGYDLVDCDSFISSLTNCGAWFSKVINYRRLNQYGLILSYREAVKSQLNLCENYPEEEHAYCEIVEIWRWLLVT